VFIQLSLFLLRLKINQVSNNNIIHTSFLTF